MTFYNIERITTIKLKKPITGNYFITIIILLFQLTHQFSQQNFHPQFETFNYNEQTQESAHGSDSFPAASSLSVGVKRAVSKDTGNSGESPNAILTDQKAFFEEGKRVSVVNNQVDYEDERSTEQSEKETTDLLNSAYFSTLPNKQAADTLATLAAAGNINNQIVRNPNQDKQESRQQSANKEQTHNDSNKQNIIKYETNSQKTNGQEFNGNDHTQQLTSSHKFASQENVNDHTQSIGHEIEEEKIREPYKNHNMGLQQYNYDQGQQSRNTQNGKEENHQSSKSPQNENRGQTFSEDDYSEDEILDPSDKDQMNQNGMRAYGVEYYKNINEKEEEHSYEDSEIDYTQEEEAEINKAETKSATMEKTVSYNAQQNQLPFGAKLRPKRI